MWPRWVVQRGGSIASCSRLSCNSQMSVGAIRIDAIWSFECLVGKFAHLHKDSQTESHQQHVAHSWGSCTSRQVLKQPGRDLPLPHTQYYGQPCKLPSMWSALQSCALPVCSAQVQDGLSALGLDEDARWSHLPQGDMLCRLQVWPSALEQRQEGDNQPASARIHRKATVDRLLARPRHPAVVRQQGHKAMTELVAAAPTRAGVVDGPLLVHAVGSPDSFVCCRIALYLVSPRHLSCDPSCRELASSAIRERVLRRQGYHVLAVHVGEWLGLQPREQEAALKGALEACLLHEQQHGIAGRGQRLPMAKRQLWKGS